MRQVMDYTVTIPRSAVISCDTCNHKYLARGRQRPVCTLGLHTQCPENNYSHWEAPLCIYPKGSTIHHIGRREVTE